MASGSPGAEMGESPPPKGDGPSLPREMHTLSRMLKELESQLDHMIEINGALQNQLDSERRRNARLEETVEEVRGALRRAEREAAGMENLRAEIDHLNAERARLADEVHRLGAELEELRERDTKHRGLVEQLRAARADAIEDLHTVEVQFERAMRLVADEKSRLQILQEQRDELATRLRSTEQELRHARQDRDALILELDESRAALDEIRQSVAEACMASGSAVGEQGPVRIDEPRGPERRGR